MRYVRVDSLGLEELSCQGYLLNTLGGEGTIIPSGEFVLEVPSGFSVPDKDQSVLVGNLECRNDAAGWSGSWSWDWLNII